MSIYEDTRNVLAANRLRRLLGELRLGEDQFAFLLAALGDGRDRRTILKSVQRAAAGEPQISDGTNAVLTLLERELARARRTAAAMEWTESEDGRLAAELQGVRLTLTPISKGRWSVIARHCDGTPNGYSPAAPHWRSSLEDAKVRAALAVDEKLDQVERIDEDDRARRRV